jgi:hypothetical protein
MTQLFKYTSLVVLLLMTSVTHAETNDCTAITSLPFDITQPGLYCLTGNLKSSRSSGSVIRVKANGVTIDLNGWTLDGTPATTATRAVGIYAFKRSNCTVRNGTIRGFYRGIQLIEPSPYMLSKGHLVEDLLVENSTYNAIHVTGINNTVRNNHVVNTGNSTHTPGLRAFGMQIYGNGARILGNDISNTEADSRSDGYGMVLGSANGSMVMGNRINNVETDRGVSYAIFISASENLLIRENNISNADEGIYYSNSTGKNMDNLTTNVVNPFTGGDQVGIND